MDALESLVTRARDGDVFGASCPVSGHGRGVWLFDSPRFPRGGRRLLESGADINAKDDTGKTPLAHAIKAKQEAMAAFLRERGGE